MLTHTLQSANITQESIVLAFVSCDHLVLISSINTHPHTHAMNEHNESAGATAYQLGLNPVFLIITDYH